MVLAVELTETPVMPCTGVGATLLGGGTLGAIVDFLNPLEDIQDVLANPMLTPLVETNPCSDPRRCS
jgi:hypothetical protein